MTRIAVATMLLHMLLGCVMVGGGEIEPNAEAAMMLPISADPSERYLFYFHGKIVEDQGLPAISPEFGEYQYEAIVERFKGLGFVVVSEQRPRGADVTVYAEQAVEQIDTLLNRGVPPEHITVVGASKGAYIAALTSHLAHNPRLNFVLLAGCHEETVAYMGNNGVDLYGNVLAIRDSVDTQLAGSCAEVFAFSAGLRQNRELVLSVGTGHGVIYSPLDEWVLPTAEWAESFD